MSVSLLTNAPWMNARVGSVSTNNLTLNGLQFPTNTPTNGEVLTYNSVNNNIEWQAGGGGGGVVYETYSAPIEFAFINGTNISNVVGTSVLYLSRVGDSVSCRLDLTDIQTIQNPFTDKCDSLMGVAITNGNFTLPGTFDLMLSNKANLLYTTNGTDYISFNYGSMIISSVGDTLQIRICNDAPNTFTGGCFVSLGASFITNESLATIVYPSNLYFSYSVN